MINWEVPSMRATSVFFLLLVLALASCASPPDEKLQAAEQALAQAEEAEADVYASDVYDEASSALQQARAEIAAQDESFAFSRDYSGAEQLLDDVVARSNESVTQAQTGKEQTRAQAETAQTEALNAIESVKSALEDAPIGKGSGLDLEVLNRDIGGAERTYEQGVSALEDGDYMSALDRLLEAKEKADTVQSYIPER
jgi:hypothetical protein